MIFSELVYKIDPVTRKKALEILGRYLKNPNLVKHSLSVEACMRELAKKLNEDEEKWAICGLVHDIDYDLVKSDMSRHSKLGYEILKSEGFDEEICRACLTHNDAHGIPPDTTMAKALLCADPATGLIYAATLVLPTKKINDLTVDNVLNRFREKGFARGARRDLISSCEGLLNLNLRDFLEACLSGMRSISEDLGI